jgi:quinoprotein glucose dehydrogenase
MTFLRRGSVGGVYDGARMALAWRPVLSLLACSLALAGGPSAQLQEWPFYGGDQAGSKYSPLTDINRENVGRLTLAWDWKPNEEPFEGHGTRPGAFQNTPLMIDNVLYISTPYNRVVALDAETGTEIWKYDPKAYEDGQPPNGTGFVHRGVAAWRDGSALRIFINSRHRLICLDAKSGKPVATFGDDGIVDLGRGLIWDVNRKHYTNTSPPIVYRDLVIVGNGVADRLVYRRDPPGDVRAFDARTGKQVWSFHTIPQQDEFGNDTWGSDSWKFTGHTNVWAPMTLDDRRGLLYLPVSTPSNDFYGGRRPGANLFAESLVCLDAGTGQRKWHYQIVHHGLWDYDLPSPPNLVTITVSGRQVEAVVQLTKMGWAFVFDRVTGEPVWPIEERPVSTSDVPGEHAWPTQPAPTKPPAFAEQGMSLDDAFDLTPELRAEAQEAMKTFRLGPLYTPPTFQGTLIRPGLIGGANWGGGAFDTESGVLYVKTSNLPHIARLARPTRASSDPRAAEVDADYVREGESNAEFMKGLPINRPPYGHLTAIELNRGEILWRIPFGDTPSLRSHPALKGVPLPERLGASGPAGAVVTRGGLVFVGGGDVAFHAIDKDSGRELWATPVARRTNGTPMTYRSRAGRQFVVIATGSGRDASLMAFALER